MGISGILPQNKSRLISWPLLVCTNLTEFRFSYSKQSVFVSVTPTVS